MFLSFSPGHNSGLCRRRRNWDAAFQASFLSLDEVLSSVFTNESVRLKLEQEIAAKANVPATDIGIDVPSLPSVPYHNALQIGATDIPIFLKTRSGEKVPQKITELSKVVEELSLFMNILRVYTKESYREQVAEAATRVLGESPLSNVLSY